jgi:hypothetical protein
MPTILQKKLVTSVQTEWPQKERVEKCAMSKKGKKGTGSKSNRFFRRPGAN